METDILKGKKIAFLATDGFEQIELTQPWDSIKRAGAEVFLVSPEAEPILGMHHDKPGDLFDVDVRVSETSADEFDGLSCRVV